MPRAVWQLINALVPYAAVWTLMYFCVSVSWWLAIPLVMLAGGLLVRIFIIFHDCGHGSYFASQRANDIAGFLTGVMTFTPYYHWRWEHAIHHSTTAHLDKRGTGDIWTTTVQDCLEIGSASSRESVCQYGLIWVFAVLLHTKTR